MRNIAIILLIGLCGAFQCSETIDTDSECHPGEDMDHLVDGEASCESFSFRACKLEVRARQDNCCIGDPHPECSKECGTPCRTVLFQACAILWEEKNCDSSCLADYQLTLDACSDFYECCNEGLTAPARRCRADR